MEYFADGLFNFSGVLYESSAINLVDSRWEDNFTQSFSPITFQADFVIENFFEISQNILWKDVHGG